MQMDQTVLDRLMTAALCEARAAEIIGEVPVGAVVYHNGEIIARAHNRVEADTDCCAHAEILAIKQASLVLDNWRLSQAVICVTLEPCSMCMGAIRLARIPLLIYGASDPRVGAAGSLYNLASDDRLGPAIELISGIKAEECAQLLKNFFRAKREQKLPEQTEINSYWQSIGSFQSI